MAANEQLSPGRIAVSGIAGRVASLCPSAVGQGERCGAGRDLVVQALERITPQSDNSAFEDALQLLKHAVSVCGELGDAWYYRSLVEQRLGHDALAKYAMDKARFNGSEAMQQGLNPLVLATPAAARDRDRRRRDKERRNSARWRRDLCSKSGRWWSASAASATKAFRA